MVPLEHASSKSPVKPAFKYILLHPKREELKLDPLLLVHLYRGWNNLVYRNINSFRGSFLLPSTLGLAIFQETVSSPSSFSGKWDYWLVLNPLHSFRAASGRAVLIFFEFEAAPWFQLFLLSSSAGWSSLVQHIYFSIRPFHTLIKLGQVIWSPETKIWV